MLNRIKKIHPKTSIAFLGIIFSILIFLNPNKGVQYGDFGLMYIQVQDIINSGYSTFSLKYEGEDIDPEYKYFPYKKPFIGKVNDKYYIDFPPFFPLVNAPFNQIFGINGVYILNYISLLFTLFLIYKLALLYDLKWEYIHLSLFLYSFGMTSTMYNLVFHEYPLAIFLITFAFYQANIYYKKQTNISLVLFGFFGALSLYFRLEMIFVIIACGISLSFVLKKDFFKILSLSLAGFILPFLLLLYLNFYIHGHPLGLRYLLTLTDNSTPQIGERIAIIVDMLFSKTRGLFYQSPFLILICLLPFFKKGFLKTERFLYIFCAIGFILILLTSPNHGDHRAPRYLFGMYPIFCVFSVVCFSQGMENFRTNLNFPKESNSLRNLKLITLISFLLLGAFSILSTFRNYQWMQRAAKNVTVYNEKILTVAGESPIIFMDYGQTLNAQSLYVNRITFVAEKLEDMQSLVDALKKKNVDNLVISQVFAFPLTQEQKLKTEETYVKNLSLNIKGDSYYFGGSKKSTLFNWIDLGKNQYLLLLNIFLN